MGRPTKLTPDVERTLTLALSEGATIAHACDYAGITPQTLANWLARGEACAAGDEAFVGFCEAMTRARGQGVVADLLTISQAVRAGDWRAAAWRLQHRYPQDYGANLKISGDADHPLHVLHTMPQDQLEARIQQLWHQCGYDHGPEAVPATTSDTTPEDLR